MNPNIIDQWFPIEQQRSYISKLIGRVGLTRRRAECFVRLWTYLLLKQQQELGERLRQPLTQLQVPEGFIACTHREAAELFYAQSERGTERAAGMMIDTLLDLGLIEKKFDGNTVCIQIRSLPNLATSSQPANPVELQLDAFNPQTDAIPVASFLSHNYNWMSNTTAAVPYKILKLLRSWAREYPKGMRVLRQCDNLQPVGFYVLYPTASESEENFFLPPSKSLHLSSGSNIDPIKMAKPGDRNCTSIFIRSWMIDTPYMQRSHACRFLKDLQETLVQMQSDFPNLCDLYAMTIHHSYEELALALGFHKIVGDPKSSVYWVYRAVDQFLALDMEKALSKLEFVSPSAEF
ncbi:MAG: hypothetical protein LDL41_03085 [Coleofasciculus sp. S288]|nr:hypothetical protein [Coleofasciculus sp. S288]